MSATELAAENSGTEGASRAERFKASGLPPASADEILDKRETAKRLKVSTRTLDQWMRAGRVPYAKIGKTVRFRWRDVLEKLETFRVN